MENQNQSKISNIDKRDIIETAISAAMGFAIMHLYIDIRENYGKKVSYAEKFIVLLVFTAGVFLLLRMLTNNFFK